MVRLFSLASSAYISSIKIITCNKMILISNMIWLLGVRGGWAVGRADEKGVE